MWSIALTGSSLTVLNAQLPYLLRVIIPLLPFFLSLSGALLARLTAMHRGAAWAWEILAGLFLLQSIAEALDSGQCGQQKAIKSLIYAATPCFT